MTMSPAKKRKIAGTSEGQYDHALKYFEPFAASRGETVEACMAFVSADGTIKDDTLKAFNAFLLAAPARVSSSVYANCIKLCGNQIYGAFPTPSTRHLLDGVAMPVPHRSTELALLRHRREMT